MDSNGVLAVLKQTLEEMQRQEGLVESGPHTLTTTEAAEELGVSSQYIREQMASGKLSAYRFGRAIRIEREQLRVVKTAHLKQARAAVAPRVLG